MVTDFVYAYVVCGRYLFDSLHICTHIYFLTDTLVFVIVVTDRICLLFLSLDISPSDFHYPCKGNPCLHSGTCSSNGTNFLCHCSSEYGGGRCESTYSS